MMSAKVTRPIFGRIEKKKKLMNKNITDFTFVRLFIFNTI